MSQPWILYNGFTMPRPSTSYRKALEAALWGNDYYATEKLLCTPGIDLNYVTRQKETPLTITIDNGNLWLFTLLLERGADPNFPCAIPPPFQLPIQFIVYCAAIEFLETILRFGAHTETDTELLTIAYERRAYLCFCHLMRLKTPSEQTAILTHDGYMDFYHEVQLHDAIYRTHPERLAQLLAQKATTTKDLLRYAITKAKSPRVLEVLRDAGFDFTEAAPDSLLHLAAGGVRDIRIVEFLIEIGLDVNACTEPSKVSHGFTPLTRAILNNEHEIVRLLLRHGARPELGDTPEIIALRNYTLPKEN